MKEVDRADYITTLVNKRHNGLIKVITGVRRCGKSYLLFTLFMRWLRQNGVGNSHIIAIALDDFKNRALTDAAALYEYVTACIIDEGQYYVLLDEIQLVEGFESVLNGFLHIPNADVYVTGSNSRFLSTDIITEFRGRGDEIRMQPFSFAEYYSVIGGDRYEAWAAYCRYGGMPQILSMVSASEKEAYLKSLFSNVYIKDIINRYGLRGQDDMDSLTDVLASSIGSLTNPKRISDTFTSTAGIKVSQPTISRYLSYLEDAFIIERATRYDIKGRRYIGTPVKYYFTDVGLRNARLNFRQQEENHIMENVVYNELRRRGYSVDVGVVDISGTTAAQPQRTRLEVDFVANRGSSRAYIQVALDISDEQKADQERRSLTHIADAFRKVIITRGPLIPWHDDYGILHISLLDFLLNAHSLEG